MAHMIFEFKDLLTLALIIVAGWTLFDMQKVKYKLSAVLGEDKAPTSTTFDLSTLPPIDMYNNDQQQYDYSSQQQYYQQPQQQQQQPEPVVVEDESKIRAAKVLQLSGVKTNLIVTHQQDENTTMTKPLEVSRNGEQAGISTYSNLAKQQKQFIFGEHH